MASRVRINHVAARALARKSTGEEMVSFLRQVENRAKVLTPVDTGRLRGSHTIRVFHRGQKVVGQIAAVTDYAFAVHEGWRRTGPIVPKRKKALRFKVGGTTVVVARVNAPASYAGRPWLWRALQEVSAQRGWKARRLHGGVVGQTTWTATPG